MHTGTSNQRILKNLRSKWGFAAVFGSALWLGFFSWLRTWWDPPYALRWLLISGLAFAYLLWVLWNSLTDNHRQGEDELLSKLGMGNIFSISRGFILVLFGGFLFSPWPDIGWTAWLPGLLYTLAVLPDFVDGAAARLTNQVTKLGETLDISLDSLGVLSVSLLSVQYGQVPWWYLPVGLARYIFLAGIWLRHKLRLPVYNLPFSVRRRGYAALIMGLFFVILYPVFTPPGTHIAASIFAIYVLAGFIWDWLLTIGWLPAQPGERYLRLENFAVQYMPLFLRILLFMWGLSSLLPNLLSQSGPPLLWAEAVVALCLILGFAGRIGAIAALVILGYHQAAAPLDNIQLGLIMLYANLLFLGTGALSLWPLEDRLIYHRVGNPR
ncbi:MAG: CDP-alcohol phosphatidyltransferase family protein [Anaerolineales bacterium]|nr:CDP-alcohol phosphatidyltransferase family protein [Anaerolineales bacterium]